MPVAVTLQDGPTERKSIDKVYSGKQLPDSLAVFSVTALKCPKIGKPFTPESNSDIFLVPLEQ